MQGGKWILQWIKVLLNHIDLMNTKFVVIFQLIFSELTPNSL